MRALVTAPARRALRFLPAVLLLAVAVPTIVTAEPDCRPPSGGDVHRSWPIPLDRPVTLHARALVLRDALDRIAAAAHLRLSYSPDGIPLNRSVCVSYDSVAVGGAL